MKRFSADDSMQLSHVKVGRRQDFYSVVMRTKMFRRISTLKSRASLRDPKVFSTFSDSLFVFLLRLLRGFWRKTFAAIVQAFRHYP